MKFTRPDTIEWKPSPNYKPYASARAISCLVIHATATFGIESPLAWLCDPNSKVSAHYLIGLDGRTIRLVDERNVAYHAGESIWKGVPHVNSYSIGIELVNGNDGKMAYPEPQLAALLALSVPICKEYDIKNADVVAHADIAPGRKNDPLMFPWAVYRSQLFAAGII